MKPAGCAHFRVDSESIDSSFISSQITRIQDCYNELINPRYKHIIKINTAITTMGAVFIFSPWTLTYVWGSTILISVTYGIINDLIACRVCPEYFTIEHVYDGQNFDKRLLKTLDPNLTALAFGMMAAAPFGMLGGGLLGIVASITSTNPIPLLISMRTCALFTLFIADILSRCDLLSGNFPQVPPHMQKDWNACCTRNFIGYCILIIYTIVVSISMLILCCF